MKFIGCQGLLIQYVYKVWLLFEFYVKYRWKQTFIDFLYTCQR